MVRLQCAGFLFCSFYMTCGWFDGVPSTDSLVWCCNHVSPVTESGLVIDIHSQQHCANQIVSTKPIIIHYNNLKPDIIYVFLLNFELKRLIEGCNKSVLFDAALPFGYSLSLVDQVHFHIGICRIKNKIMSSMFCDKIHDTRGLYSWSITYKKDHEIFHIKNSSHFTLKYWSYSQNV